MATEIHREAPIAKIKCPHCLEISLFRLVHKAFTKYFLTISESIYAECGSCKYKSDLEDKKINQYRALADLVKQSCSDENVWDFALQNDLKSLMELRDWSLTWKCTCGEENPPNFSQCWKCGEESDVEVTASIENKTNLNQSFPWEQ